MEHSHWMIQSPLKHFQKLLLWREQLSQESILEHLEHIQWKKEKRSEERRRKKQEQVKINQSINQSTLLVHPINMRFRVPITIKSNMNNRNLK